MGRKILRIALWSLAVLAFLLFTVFLLSKLGAFGVILIFCAAGFVIYKLISSNKISFQSSKKSSKKKKRRRSIREIRPIRGLEGLFDFMKSGARVVEHEETRFKDVAGLDEPKALLQETVEVLKHYEKFERLGARPPKGVLLVGPPGTGKTLLAKATAGESGVPFITINGSEFVEMFVGTAAARMRDFFNMGRAYADQKGGAILFIDEVETIGKTRGMGGIGSSDEKDQALSQMLTAMDGFDKDTNIVVIAATNKPEILDPGLTRKGRFDRKIVIDLPDKEGRLGILKIHTRKKKLSEEADLNLVAKMTPGFSGADLENLTNEAALFAARQGKKRIENSDFKEALELVTIGPKRRSKKISDFEKEITAAHEAGHALLAVLLAPLSDPPQKISIIPTGSGVGGYTQILPEDRYLYTKDYLFAQIKLLLAGRVAEEITFGKEKISTGAYDDLKRANELIWRIVCDLGMSDLGPLVFGKKEESLFLPGELSRQKTYSDQTAKEIDDEVKKIHSRSYQETLDLMSQNINKLRALAQALFNKEELDKEEIFKSIEEGQTGPAN